MESNCPKISIIINKYLSSARTVCILTLPRKPKKPEGVREMFGLPARKGFCKDVCCHVFRGTIDKLDIPIVNGVANVMVPNIDMFHAGVK